MLSAFHGGRRRRDLGDPYYSHKSGVSATAPSGQTMTTLTSSRRQGTLRAVPARLIVTHGPELERFWKKEETP